MYKLQELFRDKVSQIIKDHINYIVNTYMTAGFECYLVGGPVRDLLLDLIPKDFDFATNCPLETTKSLFPHIIPTGEDHGTLTIHIDGENYEVTRYRKDVETDGRRATIAYSETFEEDAQRRDLTINAIGFNPVTGEVKDPTNGLEDFEYNMIRFVGNPEDRITEDHLRSIRFIRFMSKFDKFGFTTDRENLDAAIHLYDHTVVSVERIYQELDAIFKILKDDEYTKNFVKHSLHDMRIFKRFISDDTDHERVINEIFESFDYFPLVRFVGDHTKVKLGHEYKKQLQLFEKFKSELMTRVKVKDLLEASDGDFDVAERVLNHFVLFNKSNTPNHGLTHLNDLKNKELKGEGEPFKVTHLKLNGEDLMAFGLKGTEIGVKQRELLVKVKENPELNTKESLTSLI